MEFCQGLSYWRCFSHCYTVPESEVWHVPCEFKQRCQKMSNTLVLDSNSYAELTSVILRAYNYNTTDWHWIPGFKITMTSSITFHTSWLDLTAVWRLAVDVNCVCPRYQKLCNSWPKYCPLQNCTRPSRLDWFSMQKVGDVQRTLNYVSLTLSLASLS